MKQECLGKARADILFYAEKDCMRCRETACKRRKVRMEDRPGDDFLTKKICDRCGGALKCGRILSMFNEDCLCITCKDKETKDPEYKRAVEAEHKEIQKGNFNYKGIRGK